MTTASKIESPANICLRRANSFIEIQKDSVMDLENGCVSIEIKLETRAWVCPFCKQSTEYVVVNGNTLIGCGMATKFANGRSADFCDACSFYAQHFIDTGQLIGVREEENP